VTLPGETDRPAGTIVLQLVTAAGAADVRRQVSRAAGRIGLRPEQADLFTVAVNEIVINAIQHGGGTAEVTIAAQDGRVVVDVRDHGRGIGRDVHALPPPPEQTHGRGLWLARQLCREVAVLPSDDGTHIRLSVAAHGG
jgi:serine/threonine-protein kinase RsbW